MVIRGDQNAVRVAAPFAIRSRRRTLIVIVAVGAVLRLTWFLYVRPTPVSDFADYLHLARDLVVHHQFGYPEPTAYRLPLYPLVLAGGLWIRDSVVWLSLCNVALSSALPLMAFHLVHLLTQGRVRWALAAAVVCAVHPTFVCLAPVLASEHLFGLLLLAGLMGSVRAAAGGWGRALLAGAAAGAAVLTRGEGVFYLPVLAALSAGKAPRRGWSGLLRPLMVVSVCAITVTPWVVRNRLTFRSPVGLSTSAGLNLYLAHNAHHYGWRSPQDTELAGLDPVAAHQAGRALAWNCVMADPLAVAGRVARGTVELYRPSAYAASWSLARPRTSADAPYTARPIPGVQAVRVALAASYILLFGLAATTVAGAGWRGLGWGRPLCVLIALNWLCYAAVFWSQPRYRYVSELMMTMLAAPAVCKLAQRVVARGRSRAVDADDALLSPKAAGAWQKTAVRQAALHLLKGIGLEKRPCR